jgi:hypothetical protein
VLGAMAAWSLAQKGYLAADRVPQRGFLLKR